MALPKLKQLQYESDTWKRLLAFMMDETVHLKNRLSEVLKEKFDSTMLNEMENFQNNFIKEDELINLLRNDITEFDKLLTRELFEDGNIKTKMTKKMNDLRQSIVIAESKFGKLKSDFHSFLSENI
jgi:hypothetical protein